MTIGEKIRQLRLKNGYSQVDLAMKANVSKQTLYKYEHGIINNIPADKIERIAEILNTTPSYLVGWDDEKTDNSKTSLGDKVKKINDKEVYKLCLELLGWNIVLNIKFNSYTLSNGNVSFKMSADEFERMMDHSKNDLNQYILNLINEKSK